MAAARACEAILRYAVVTIALCACAGGRGSASDGVAGGASSARARPGREIDRSDLPLAKASEEQLARFALGDELFEATFRDADGLGPLYVRASCAACHRADGRGPGRVGKLVAATAGDAAALLPFGATERPYVSAGAKQPIALAAGETRVKLSYRFPPAVFGRGYFDAIADSEIERLAREASARGGNIRGRVHYVMDGGVRRVGRFGLKARLATLEAFTADALHGDMGITSPRYPDEAPNPDHLLDDDKPGVDVGDDVVAQLADYVRMLELPARKPASPGEQGARAFAAAQCATCHVPALATRRDYPIAALAGVDAPVYSDLLLHDMGDGLADGLREGDAGPREYRTAPLIGLRFFGAFLHDGRAKTVEQAVLAHQSPGSEANDAVAKYRALPRAEQRALLAFVAAL